MNTPPPLVSIVLDNWNGRRYLDACLAALACLTYSAYEVILVDDASTDDSMDGVGGRYPEVRIIRESCHHGFAGANNIGMRAARGEIIVLLNVDTVPARDFLEPLVRALSDDPRVGCCQAKLLFMRAPDLLDSAGSWFTWTGFLLHRRAMTAHLYDRQEPIFAAKGAAMALRRGALDRVGLFDDEAYAYFEDADLSWRLWIAGYQVLYVPESRVLHAVGGSSDAGGVSSTIQFHNYKNRVRSLLRNLEGPTLLRVLPVHIVLLLALSGVHLLRREPFYAGAITRALLWNAWHLPATLRLRAATQRTRRWPDRAFLPRLSRSPSLWFFAREYVLCGAPTSHRRRQPRLTRLPDRP